MMTALKNAMRRFGGAALVDALPQDDERTERGPRVRAMFDARLKAIQVDLDVQARKPLNFDR